VGNYPGRIEAESAALVGYAVRPVTPPEAASGEKAVECSAASCTATFKYSGESGWRDVVVRYFDVNSGVAKFRVKIAGQLVAEWSATDRVPSRRVDSGSSARHVVEGVMLRPGDEIQIEGIPDGGETAALDYIEVLP
jgi:alpha-glucuronidase